MNTTIDDLYNLMHQYPDYPIYCKIDGEICDCFDDYAWIQGDIGYSYAGHICYYNERLYEDIDGLRETVYADFDDVLSEKFNYKSWVHEYALKGGDCSEEELKINKENEKKLDEFLESIIKPLMKPCIYVYVGASTELLDDNYDKIRKAIEELESKV